MFASAIALEQAHLDQPNAKLNAEALIAWLASWTVSLPPSPWPRSRSLQTRGLVVDVMSERHHPRVELRALAPERMAPSTRPPSLAILPSRAAASPARGEGDVEDDGADREIVFVAAVPHLEPE